MGVIQISWSLNEIKTFVWWNNPTKLFCQNIYSFEDIADQIMYKMQTQNLLPRVLKCNNPGLAQTNSLKFGMRTL